MSARLHLALASAVLAAGILPAQTTPPAQTTLPTHATLPEKSAPPKKIPQNSPPQTPTSLLTNQNLLRANVEIRQENLARAERVPTQNPAFPQAWRLQVNRQTPDTNYVQITVPIQQPVAKGEALVLQFSVRGPGARASVTFSQGSAPWTASTIHTLAGPADGSWATAFVPFTAALDHPAGNAVLFVKAAFGPQTVEISNLSLSSYGPNVNLDLLWDEALKDAPTRQINLAIDPAKTAQTLAGLGGNVAKSRFLDIGAIQDPLGRWLEEALDNRFLRIGIPLHDWEPTLGQRQTDNPRFQELADLVRRANRRNAKVIASVWQGPAWAAEDPQTKPHVWRKDRYDQAARSLASLVRHLGNLGAHIDFVSFNESDIGVDVKFSPSDLVDFMRVSLPILDQHRLPHVKWLIADTANGQNSAPFIQAALEAKDLHSRLGPVAFHSWDAESARDEDYRAIAKLAAEFQRPVWVTEAGFDPHAWRSPSLFPTRTNALRLAAAYARCVNLAQAQTLLYWQYQDDYPLGSTTTGPYPAFHLTRALQSVLAPGRLAIPVTTPASDIHVIASVDPQTRAIALLIVNLGPPAEIRLTTNDRRKLSHADALLPESNWVVSENTTHQLKIPARSAALVLEK